MIAATTFYIQAFVNHGNQYNKWNCKETTIKSQKKYIFPFVFLRSVPLKKKPPVCIIFRIADLAITLSLSLCCEVFNILTSFQRPTPPRHIMNLLFNLLWKLPFGCSNLMPDIPYFIEMKFWYKCDN